MKPVVVKSNTCIDSNKEINDQHPKLVILLEYQNIKIFFAIFTLQIHLKKFL